MTRYEDLPYRACVGMMLINKAGLAFIGRRDNFCVPHRSARLNCGCRARFRRRNQAIREREERVAANDAAQQ